MLVAVLDGGHQSQGDARSWLIRNAAHGRASCPITQNGCARIISQPSYPNSVPTSLVLSKLATATADPHHEFWQDSVSLLDPATAVGERIHGPRQLTDLYILALAVARGGRFVTFDGAIATSAIRSATKKHLVVL